MEKDDLSSSTAPSMLNQADDMLHSGFQQLIQHNAAPTSYPHTEQQSVDIESHMGSNPHSRYSSPDPQTNTLAVYGRHTPIHHSSPYAVSPYTGGYHTVYPADPSPYPQLPDVGSSTASHNAYSTPATSPPTPVQADGMTTRSGRAIGRPPATATTTRSPRVERQPTTARAKKRKRPSGKMSAITLDEPLSELVRNMTDVTDADIEAYVNRSPEERRREVSQSKCGKVKRPMNAFMLYRKAYQNRTKEWKRLDDIRRKEEDAGEAKPDKGHDNHQVISQVCGSSWNIEPQELRDQYDEWAKVERNNHKLAFPDYKFAPAKSKAKRQASRSRSGSRAGGRGGDDSDDEDNASNLDAYDFQEWGQAASGPPSRNATRSTQFADPDASEYALSLGYPHSAYATPSPNLQAARLPGPQYTTQHIRPPPHPPAFYHPSPGKPRPGEYGSTLTHGHYYQAGHELPPHPAYLQHYAGTASYGGINHHHHHPGMLVENMYPTSSPVSSFHHGYGDPIVPSSSYAPSISHPHAAIPPPHRQPQPLRRPLAEHQIDPSLVRAHQEHGGGAHDPAYDALELLGLDHANDFAADGLSAYQLDQHGAGRSERSHMGSPHQQLEQSYHTPGAGVEGGRSSDPTPQATTAAVESSSPWQDDIGALDAKAGSSDWEATLGSAAEFPLEDIDQLLGTTTDGPDG